MAPNPYESDRYLAEYLLFHYGGAEEILPWEFGPRAALDFPARTVEAFRRAGKSEDGSGRALDLGCAVGASTFRMARFFGEVTGLDFSARFIAAANSLRAGQPVSYERVEEGGLTTPLLARCPDPEMAGRTRFLQGDAMDLPGDWRGFDAVHAANLLCRLPEPMRLIRRLPGLVKPGGLLVLATPCSWLEEFTPRENWLGGTSENGRAVRTIDRLRALLLPDFLERDARDEPFLIREHARKYQWSVALVSTWERRTPATPA